MEGGFHPPKDTWDSTCYNAPGPIHGYSDGRWQLSIILVLHFQTRLICLFYQDRNVGLQEWQREMAQFEALCSGSWRHSTGISYRYRLMLTSYTVGFCFIYRKKTSNIHRIPPSLTNCLPKWHSSIFTSPKLHPIYVRCFEGHIFYILNICTILTIKNVTNQQQCLKLFFLSTL